MPATKKEIPEPTDEQVRELLSGSGDLSDGKVEMDANAVVSQGSDNGAYVQVWMWVSFSGTKFDKKSDA